MKKIIQLFAIAAILSGCGRTIQVTPVSKLNHGSLARSGSGGFFYSLPKTIIVTDIIFEYSKNIVPETEFKDYAENTLKLNVLEDKKSLTIKDVQISTIGVKDGKNTFFAKISDNPFSSHSTKMDFNTEGILTSTETSAHNKIIDYVSTTVQNALAIASGKIAPAKFRNVDAPEDGKAEKQWGIVMGLIEDRENVLKNPGVSLDLVKKIEDDIDAQMAQFIGSTVKKTFTLRFMYEPDCKSENRYVELFAFNPKSNKIVFCRNPVNRVKIVEEAKTDEIPECKQKVYLILSTSGVPERSAAKALVGSQTNKGLHYRIPAKGLVQIKQGENLSDSKQVARHRCSIAQRGVIAALPYCTGSQKINVTAKLDPVTGALQNVGISGDPADIENINKLGGAISGYVTARESRKAQKNAEDDVLADLERRKIIAETELAIEKAKSDLNSLRSEQNASEENDDE